MPLKIRWTISVQRLASLRAHGEDDMFGAIAQIDLLVCTVFHLYGQGARQGWQADCWKG